jgi:hypothetical protein
VYFEVEMDHKCNTFFQSQPNLLRRQARWSEFLQRFGKFKWDYRPGEQNVADALSRRDVATSLQDFVSVVKALAVCAAAVLSRMYDWSSKPGQAERLDCDQGCASTLTFDLPSSLLKSLSWKVRFCAIRYGEMQTVPLSRLGCVSTRKVLSSRIPK